MSDENKFCYLGTPLPALEKPDGSVSSAKRHPIRPEDQIVTDENGKRRFHGAFTGGFSAGYWNTVGSQEGWQPQTFKSSRSEKAPKRQEQRPEDFMDDEDMGEFGIAPKKVQVRPEFAMDSMNDETEGKSRKRKFEQPNVGPIPGQPVLDQLLKTTDTESVAVRIMKQWGWRTGRGIGPRLTHKQKKLANERNKRETYVMERYGCDMPEQPRKPIGYDNTDDDDMQTASDGDSDDDGITYAPEDFEPWPAVKENRYGLGYTPLSRSSVLAQDILAQTPRAPQTFEVIDKNKKKFSITGQAFGVGALEDDDDEEVYHREDMSKYDFSLEDEQTKRKETQKKVKRDKTLLEGFVEPTKDLFYKPKVVKLDMPADFKPRNWAERRSRFDKLDPERERLLRRKTTTETRPEGASNAEITPEQRGQLLGEGPPPTASADAAAPPKGQSHKCKILLERIANSSSFIRGGIITADGDEIPAPLAPVAGDVDVQQERKALLEKAKNKTKHLNCTMVSGNFKPFAGDDAKQNRYEQFLAANLKSEAEIGTFLSGIQPVHLSEFDREMEKKEFIQARNIYKPLGGVMSDRFVSESVIEAKKAAVKESLKDAEDKKVVLREKSVWKPSSLLCKRYNIPEPYGGAVPEEKMKPNRSKSSVFDYLETSVNKKSDFQTPVIIPKLVEKPQPIVRDAAQAPPVPPDEVAPPLPLPPPPSDADNVATTSDGGRRSRPRGFVARTELQRRVVASIEKPPAENVELFKAIFDQSDDEDESENKAKTAGGGDEKKTEAPLPVNGSAQPKSAAAANLLRNMSPPRGIFAALFNIDTAKPPPPPPGDVAPAASATTFVNVDTTKPPPPGDVAPTEVTSSSAPAMVIDGAGAGGAGGAGGVAGGQELSLKVKIPFKPRDQRMFENAAKENGLKATGIQSTPTPAPTPTAAPTPTPPPARDNAPIVGEVYGPKLPDVDDIESRVLKLLQSAKEHASKNQKRKDVDDDDDDDDGYIWVERKLDTAESESNDSESDSSSDGDGDGDDDDRSSAITSSQSIKSHKKKKKKHKHKKEASSKRSNSQSSGSHKKKKKKKSSDHKKSKKHKSKSSSSSSLGHKKHSAKHDKKHKSKKSKHSKSKKSDSKLRPITPPSDHSWL